VKRLKTPPQHGERRCYMAGCRRPECRAANSTYNKQYRVAQYGKGNRRVDAAPYTDLVRTYVDVGWSRAQLAKRTGVSETTIVHLVAGKLARINPDVASGLDKLPAAPSTPDGRAFVDATGTVRRGRALFRIGHQIDDMAAELDLNPDTLSRILNREGGYVLASTAHNMTALYKRLRWTPGKLLGNRTRAIKRGWHGPMAWDGNIDDPQCKPDLDGSRVKTGRSKGDSPDPARVARLTAEGLSAEQIARELRCHKRTVVRARSRARGMGVAA
jgi:AraC-like DNA-binding protein